jgi:hypothetical protein
MRRTLRELAAVALVLVLTLGLMLAALAAGLAEGAGGGVSAAGYAQAAQAALGRAGHPAGYLVRCKGRVTDWATQQVRVSCLMSHPGPPHWRGQQDTP